MNKQELEKVVFAWVAFACCLSLDPAHARDPDDPGIHFAASVESQWRSLSLRGDGLAFGIADSPDPSLCKHYQGMARLPRPGVPYLYISRSGSDPGAQCVSDDDYGDLVVVRMGSRDTDGERLRTNRLIRDWDPAQAIPTIFNWTKPPDPRDRVVTSMTLDSRHGAYRSRHPGGMQIVGDILAVPLENPAEKVAFMDVSEPENPRFVAEFATPDATAVIGLTPVLNPDGPGFRYLLLVTGGDNSHVRLYRSLPTNTDGSTDLSKVTQEHWVLVRHRTEGELESCLGEDWPVGRDAWQSLNFVREDSMLGTLFLIGGRNNGFGGEGQDLIGLFTVDVDRFGNPRNCLLRSLGTRHVTSFPFNGHGDSAALTAASGAYVTPSGELIFYGTEYENDGPPELNPDGTPGRKTVRFVEWRNRNVVRPLSPSLRPSLELNSPASREVDEGSAVAFSAKGSGPRTKAWIALFEDEGSGATFPGLGDDDDWMQVDYDDWAADHFDDFSLFDASTGTDFNEGGNGSGNAGSWRWFAPKGCTIRANEDQFFATTGVFPGRRTRTLVGDGQVHVEDDLDAVLNDAGDASMDDAISSVQFFADCDAYYDAIMRVAWDFDGNGSFEARGPSVQSLDPAVEGPADRIVNVRAEHPLDTSTLGFSRPQDVQVHVRNVAPRIVSSSLLDRDGGALGGEVPAGVPVRFAASFTDPGTLDTQTARVDWGDGLTETAFDVFSDAQGGATGRLERVHRFAPGTWTVTLSVTDDDGGSTSLARTVVALPADLAMSMTAPAETQVRIGGETLLTWTVQVSNLGPGTAAGIVVRNTSPAETTFVSVVSDRGSCTAAVPGAPVECTIASLPASAKATIRITTKVRPALLGIRTLTNSATVASESVDPKASNNTATAKVRVIGVLTH